MILSAPATHLIGDRENLPNVEAPVELASTHQGAVKEEMLSELGMNDSGVASAAGANETRRNSPESDIDVKPDISSCQKFGTEDSGAPDTDDYQGPALADAWTKDATADLAQLGKIFTELLFMPLLSSFDSVIKRAASDRRGPAVNVVAKLDALLRKVVVRHQAKDIEAEQPIPSLSIYQTGFTMSHSERLTYNFMQGWCEALGRKTVS